MDDITLLASTMASISDPYSNLSGTVVFLVSELIIMKKNLVDVLKDNDRIQDSLWNKISV